jgi:hypothetical protein
MRTTSDQAQADRSSAPGRAASGRLTSRNEVNLVVKNKNKLCSDVQ